MAAKKRKSASPLSTKSSAFSPPRIPVRESPRHNFTHLVFGSRLLVLLFSLVLFIVGNPFFTRTPYEMIAQHLLFALIIIISIWAVSFRRIHLAVTSLIGLGVLTTSYLTFAMPALADLYILLLVLFFSYVAMMLLFHVVTVRQVTYSTFSGAICVFLLIGFIFSGLYLLVESQQPGSLMMQNPLSSDWDVMLYYSFMTLTTVGYGDITPASSLTQSLAILESVIGLFFTAVLIARLMGLSLNNHSS